MNAFQQFIHASAIDVLEGFDKAAALQAGIATAKVDDWQKTHEVYFGATTSLKKQREAREKARAAGFALDQLVMIERELRKIKHSRSRNRVRLALLAMRGTYKELMALVKLQIPKLDRPPKVGVRFSKSRNRLRTVSFTYYEELLADLEHALTHKLAPDRPAMEQIVERLVAILRGEGSGISAAVRRPIVAIALDQYLSILGGKGDDVVLGLTDGTTMTGAEYLAENHSKQLEVALFHPQHGPVNLYRGERLANQKQRDLARMTTPVCPVPDCRHGADSCEIHHVTAWRNGGETNLANLAPLCRYHNRVNDDDPKRKKRGRVEIVSGEPVWVSPRGYAVKNPYHPFGAMQILFGG